jgi:hypothetical protein
VARATQVYEYRFVAGEPSISLDKPLAHLHGLSNRSCVLTR